MMHILITEPDGANRELMVGDDCVIGKGAQCEIHLSSWRVSKEHARLFKTPSGVLLEDMGALAA